MQRMRHESESYVRNTPPGAKACNAGNTPSECRSRNFVHASYC